MSRKQYESYYYEDPDFEYTYPNSNTLRNKLEIIDQKLALEKVSTAAGPCLYASLTNSPHEAYIPGTGNQSLQHIQKQGHGNVRTNAEP